MRLLIQRVFDATITIDHKEKHSINQGMIVYIGIHKDDTKEQLPKAIERTLNINIFENEEKKLKNSLQSLSGDILIVSNFTLYGRNKKGNQLDFTDAGGFAISKDIYDAYVSGTREAYNEGTIITGEFGAYMEIESRVDGPVNIVLEV